MQKIIFFIIFLLIPLTLFSEEKKSVASRVALLNGSLHPISVGNGNLLVGRALVGSDGKVIRQVIPKGDRGAFFFPTRKDAIGDFTITTLVFHSTKEELKKLGEVTGEGFGPNHLGLKNGNVLIARSGDGYLKIVGTDGTTKFHVKVETKKVGLSPQEFSDGTIVISSVGRYLFFSPDLKPLKQIDTVHCIPRGFVEHADLFVCFSPGAKLSFITSNGDIKFSFNANNKRLNSILSLPNGLIALMVDDGYIHFLDAEGNRKFSHFHDTEVISDLALVSDKVLAYWNKTEIVFVDFEGKELGIFPIIATPEKSLLGRNRLIGLGNGTVVAIDGQGLHFIKLK
jgi:hypothetical protein